MNLLNWLKSFLKKELEDVLAPLENIKSDIAAFIHRQEIEIEKDVEAIKIKLAANAKRSEANIKASAVAKNLETLLGGK